MFGSPTSSSESFEPFTGPITFPNVGETFGSQPTFRSRKPESLRIDTLGISPTEMIGRQLKRITRSATHPVITFYFTDDTSFQVRVDGYNPGYPGLPKALETDPELEPIMVDLDNRDTVYTISQATLITLTDRAFQAGKQGRADSEWKQIHSAIAFKLQEEGRWHCLWATLAEFDAVGRCIFRSFDDVYLERVERVPQKSPQKSPQKKRWSNGRRVQF
ncbi:hypothetical protein QCA50_009557 [Cerrena zonata]|uniref:Uncharacterized protein n=1 Tax=Cerrena zonata TaxID=2478898 RepID=A0AAW0GAW9_9APHY